MLALGLELLSGYLEEGARLAGKRNLKLLDAMDWLLTVSVRYDFFVTNDVGFKSAG